MVVVDDFERGPEKDFALITPKEVDDGDLPPHIAASRRIRYIDDDEEAMGAAGPSRPLRRRNSTYSVHSLSSVRSGRAVDPSLALPVQYRTLSYTIANADEAAAAKAKDAREKAAIGTMNNARNIQQSANKE